MLSRICCCRSGASMLKSALPYHHDSATFFECIAHLAWPMMLDSGQALHPQTGKPGSQYGRYDILVASPVKTYVTNGKYTEITENGTTEISEENPFDLIKSVFAQYAMSESSDNDLPFSGGAVGYFGYDLALYFEKLPSAGAVAAPKPMHGIPALMIGIYEWAVVVDHRQKTTHLVANYWQENAREKFNALEALFYKACSDAKKVEAFQVTTDVISNMTKARYAEAFEKVKRYILEGDCYQVNLAQRFSAQANGSGWLAYKKLREISPAPFMAYMRLPNLEVLSASPERFLQVVGRHVETRPIKGTRPRSEDVIEDARQATALQNSLKDRAENLMIVDLLRNDIGKNCEIGSVKAEKLFQLQSFANVHHLVSIVTGKLASGKSALDLLRGCFPGGSITGAPKLRAMQIIDELEPSQRGLYCGAIGYIGFDGNMDTNIAIRTAVYQQNEVSFYAGGGIVADSTMEKEYIETLDKASSMLRLMRFFKVDMRC